MLSSQSLSAILLAVAGGDVERALNVVARAAELDDETRRVLSDAVGSGRSSSETARRLGDTLRSLGAARGLANECYRVAFYTGDSWKDLAGNPLFAYFAANQAGNAVDKWVHYFPIYDRHLGRFRDRPVRVLEIGVYRGGGLDLVGHYLGAEAVLVGIDIDPAARAAVRGHHPVEVGDQEDPDFLRRVSDRHGPFDVVIDDGGHTMRQQIVSVETLFPLLVDGGVYLIEDTHTSFWPEYASSDGKTLLDWAKERVDDLHAHHHSKAATLTEPWQTRLDGIHVYDGVVVLDNARRDAPFSEVSGSAEFINYGREPTALNLELGAARDAALAKAAEAEERIRIVRDELSLASAALREMRRSRSWRITAPLRWGRSRLRDR